MTSTSPFKPLALIALAIVIALAVCLHWPAAANNADGPFLPQTTPVPLDPADPSRNSIGELTYMGGVEIQPGDENVGGISGLEWHDGQLYAVADSGHWLILTPDAIQGRLTDVIEIEIGELLDERGKRLRRKDDGDAEAIALDAEGNWLVAFERNHRVWRYSDLTDNALPASLDLSQLMPILEGNSGLETLATTPEGWIACAERQARDGHNCLRQSASGLAGFSIATPPPLEGLNGVPTDADCASNGVCFVLFRSYIPAIGNSTAIVALSPDGNRETLAHWGPELTVDNFEGLAVREEGAKTFLYIISDNNFSNDQRNLLMKFEVSARAATTPGVPEKVFKTDNVVIETSVGKIYVQLETERAPVTVANFLAYVDEGRFKDTRCYRAMRVQGAPGPSGFVQCGTQNRPDRVLEPIAHEPTNETGLSHLDGALSMARFEPGTATGDFSIMILDQRGLDADPDHADPSRKAGFAVFGYVIDGMDTVIDIQQAPIDPDKGEGFLKGQLLAEPVTILDIRRAPQPGE